MWWTWTNWGHSDQHSIIETSRYMRSPTRHLSARSGPNEVHTQIQTELWKHLKGIVLHGNSKADSSICLKINDNICHDSKSVADHFNNFFSTISSTLVGKLPVRQNTFNEHCESFRSCYRQRNSESNVFKLRTVSESFVWRGILNLNPI